MPVGTVGSVKALAPDDLAAIGAQIVLGNTYHLMLRPGPDLVEELGGLHRFMSWGGCVLTDSGGFQVYSLAEQRKITEEGALFRSHLDGSRHLLTPERAIEIQGQLGSDILMCFDECPPAQSDRAHHLAALERTTRWARRCKAAWAPATARATSSASSRAASSKTCARATPGRSRRSTCPAARSAASRSARSRRRCGRASPTPRRSCPPASRAT